MKIHEYNEMMAYLTRPAVNRVGFRLGTTPGGNKYSTTKNVSKNFIHPIKNNLGEVLWYDKPQGNKGKFDSTKTPPLESQKNNKRYKFDISKNKWIYQARDKDSPDYTQKEGETFKDFHERRKTAFIEKSAKRTKGIYLERQLPTLKKINNWTKDWLDKNLKNFKLKDKEKFIKAIKDDYAKFVKKEFGNISKIGNTNVFSPDNLPNVSRSVTDQMDIFKYDGFQPVDMGKFGGRLDVNPSRRKTLQPFLEKIFWKNKIETTPGLAKDLKEYFKFITTNKTLVKNRDFVKNFKPNDDVLWLLKSSESGLKDVVKRDVINSIGLGEDLTAYNKRINMGELWKNNAKVIEETLGPKEMKRLTGYEKIEPFMKAERKSLKKIFDYTKLPKDLQLAYAADHAQGLAVAARSGNKDFMRLAVTDLIGSTVKENTILGRGEGKGESFERQRGRLFNQIKAGDKSKVKELNKLVEDTYGVKNVYSIKDGKLVAKPISPVTDQTGRFKQYLEKVSAEDIAKKEIIRQGKINAELRSLLSNADKPTLMAIRKALGCMSEGGRVGLQGGGNLLECPMAKFAQDPEGTLNAVGRAVPETRTPIINALKNFGAGTLKWGGRAFIGLTPIFAGMEIADASRKFEEGQPTGQIVADAIGNWVLPGVGEGYETYQKRKMMQELANPEELASFKKADQYKKYEMLQEDPLREVDYSKQLEESELTDKDKLNL